MKNLKILILSACMLLMAGCNDYLDVNTDPDNPTSASINLVLPAAQISMASVIGGFLQNTGGYWAQFYTQSPEASQYQDIDSYNITTDFFDRDWQEIYAGALNDYKYVIETALEEEEYQYYLIASLMQIYTFQVLVDLHNKIPYSEALDPSIIEPGYDDGEFVYADLLDRIDETVSLYLEHEGEGSNPRGNDLVFGGDAGQWLRFANSLKLKLLMRMSYTDMADGQAVMALINEDNFITEDATITQFSNQTGQRNFFFEEEVNHLNASNQIASNTLLKFLVINDDPRLPAIYMTNNAGQYRGIDQGDFVDNTANNPELSMPAYSATTPVYLMTVAEIKFYIAEALIRYNSGGAAVQTYEEAIEASFDIHGVSGAEALYGPGGPYELDLTGNVEADIEMVMIQKWVAFASVNNIEAFFERNRTGYPGYTNLATTDPGYVPGTFTYSINSVLPAGRAPRRFFFPDVSVSRNTNTPAQPNSIAEPVWWDRN